jgi:1-deoxy-D-xylulose-5-phosphate reductoisomerase
MMKKIAILGSTGSVGKQVLDVVVKNRELFELVGLGANSNIELLSQQALEFNLDKIFLNEVKDFKESAFEIIRSQDDFLDLIAERGVELFILTLSGTEAIKPLIFALEKGIDVAIANKEAIIAAGTIIEAIVKKSSSKIIPLDSEHNAIYQLLNSNENGEVSKVFLTCSGGPFLGFSERELEDVSLEMALAHPRWDMGKKITIDSANLMNKGFEVIEAHYLFGLAASAIEVLIHPEAIVHAMVELRDGTTFAQMSPPDMRMSIAYALGYPDRIDLGLNIDWKNIKMLNFKEASREDYPALDIAYRALERRDSSLPAFIVKADEIIVAEFLKSQIAFKDILPVLRESIERHRILKVSTIEDVETAFSEAESITADIIKEVSSR